MNLAFGGPSRIMRDGLWVALGQTGVILGTLVGGKLLTTLLSVENYGYFGMLSTLTTLGMGVFGAPFLQATLRYYPDAVREDKIGPLRAMIRRYLFVGVLIMGALLLVGGAGFRLLTHTGLPFLGFVFAGTYFAADLVRSLESNLLNGARRQRDLSLRSVADAWAKPLFAVLAIAALGASCVSVLLGYSIGSAAVSAALIGRTIRGRDSSVDPGEDPWIRSMRASILAFAIPLAPLAILSWIANLGDRYLLAGIAGAGATGVYIAGYGLASTPFIATNSLIHTTLRPVLYDAVARGDHAKERRTLWIWLGLVVAVMGSGVVLMALLSVWIARLCLGPQFQSASVLLPWIGAAYALLSLQQTFEIIMLARGQTRRLVLLQAVAAIAGLAFYLTLIPRFGALGAAIGTLGAFAVSCAASVPLAAFPWAPLRATPAELVP